MQKGDDGNVPDTELAVIGPYFGPDAISPPDEPRLAREHDARLAFLHNVAPSLLIEACLALDSLANAKSANGQVPLVNGVLGHSLVNLLVLQTPTASALEERVNHLLDELELWVRNPKKHPYPSKYFRKNHIHPEYSLTQHKIK